MNDRASERNRPNVATARNRAEPHPLDRWLRRELRALHGTGDDQALPDDIADLAARLEERLSEGGGRGAAPDEATAGAASRGQESPDNPPGNPLGNPPGNPPGKIKPPGTI